MEDTQKTILKVFYDTQYETEEGYWSEDEFVPLIVYKELQEKTGLSLRLLRANVLDLRDAGVMELCMSVDGDYIPNGSGYMLTDKGKDMALKLFDTKKK